MAHQPTRPRKRDIMMSRHSAASDPNIVGEQLRLLQGGGIDLAANLLAAGAVSYFIWPVFRPWIVLAWLSSLCLLILGRAFLRRRFRATVQDTSQLQRWGRIFTVTALATAMLWGSVGFVFLATPEPSYHIFLVFVLGGVMAAGMVRNSAFLPAMIAFQVPTVLPSILILFYRADSISVTMGIMLSIFCAVLIATGRAINGSIVDNVGLRYQQTDLLEVLRRDSAVIALRAAIVDSSDDAIVSETVNGEILSWNRGAERTLGFSADEMIGKKMLPVVAEDHRANYSEKRALLLSGSHIASFDTFLLCKNGTKMPVSLSVSTNTDGQGKPVGTSFIARNMTERMAADRIQAYQDRLLHAVTIGAALLVKTDSLDQAMPEALGIIGEALGIDRVMVMQQHPVPNTRYLWQRPGSLPLIDKSAYDALPVSEIPAISAWRAQMDGGKPLIAQLATSEGSIGNLLRRVGIQSLLAVPIMAGTGLWGNLGIDSCAAVREWTEYEIETLKIFGEMAGSLISHREMAQALEESLERFRSVATAAQDGIVTIDVADRIALWNPAAERMLGYMAAEAIGRPAADFIVPRNRASFEQTLESFEVPGDKAPVGRTTEIIALHKDGREITIELSLAATRQGDGWGGIGILRDITERNAAAAKLIFANTMLRSEMEASLQAIVVFDPNLRVAMFNRRFVEMWNIPAAHVMGATLEDVLAHAKPLLTDPAKFSEKVYELVGHHDQNSQEEYPLTDGRIINRDILTLSGPDGQFLGRAAYFRDVTEQRNADDKLQFANLLLKTQMEASLDGILIVNAERKIIAFNQRVADIWHIPPAELTQGDDDRVLTRVVAMAKDEAQFRAGVEYLYDHIDEDRAEEVETKDGRCIERNAVTLTATTGKHLGRAWFFRDITERREAAAYALKMARYDVLTGLANRAVFVEALEHAIAAAKRGEKSFAVLYLDLDHFKDVNDTLGHPVGDELLKQVADLLRSKTRAADTVARFGGDEFAVVVSDIDDPADAAMLAKNLIAALALPFHVEGSEIHTGASIGIATYDKDSSDGEALLSHADVALYRAKSEGRGGYRFFTEAMDNEVKSRVKLGSELREAIDGDQLFLMFQPQVAIRSGRITGVEALVRWKHPQRGVLGPDSFIPLAEQIGVITPLGHWVLWAACRQAKVWLDAGIKPVRTAVNVSALQFKAPMALEADVTAALDQTGLPPHLLELEITESVLMGVTREHSDVLQRLRATGITIAIDDFGTGYSSLEYLRRFAPDRIKIAQVFVTNLETHPDDAMIIRATIGLARDLGIDVIAEGVATDAQAKLIAGWGGKEAQGFLFAQPLTADEATAALRAGSIRSKDPAKSV